MGPQQATFIRQGRWKLTSTARHFREVDFALYDVVHARQVQ